MQNAFTAIADDASAVYYNPAGLASLRQSQASISGIYVDPAIAYANGDAESVSTRSGAGVSLFYALRIDQSPWFIGMGLYAPVARSTRFAKSPQLGSMEQSSKTLRIDLAAMVSRSWGPCVPGLRAGRLAWVLRVQRPWL